MSADSSPSKDRSATSEWLESILEGHFATAEPDRDDKIEILDWNINPAEGEGYLFEVLTIDVRYTVGDEPTRAYLVAKLLPQDAYNRAFVTETQFDLREIKFYTEIVPALEEVQRESIPEDDVTPLPIPSCFHAAYKEDTESILVMENVKFKGFSHQELNLGLTICQAEAAVVSLSQIHAAAYALQLKHGVELDIQFPYLLSQERAEEAFHTLFEKGLLLLLKYLQNKPEHAAVRTRLQNYAGNISRDIFQRVLTPSENFNTMVHCDFWSNNLLFKTSNSTTTCCIIDWQMLMKGRPAVDIGMLITTSLSPQTRRTQEDRIIKTYWNAFTTNLHKLKIKEKDINYNLDDFASDLKDGKLFGALIMIGSVDMALGTPIREERVLSIISDLIKDGIM